MLTLAERVMHERVPEGGAAVFFVGQAGFIIKDGEGRLTAIDLYLSDCCERYFGLKRLMPKLLEPGELTFDVVIATHAHYDHFDPDAMPALLADARTRFIGALDTRAECERLGIAKDGARYLSVGEEALLDNLSVRAAPCDHGELARDAIGLMLNVSGKRIYVAGDTGWRPDYFADSLVAGADLMIVPINGAYGNLNERQAAAAVALARPGRVVPCHYWNFAEHGGDPGRFLQHMLEEAPEIPVTLMSMGGCLQL